MSFRSNSKDISPPNSSTDQGPISTVVEHPAVTSGANSQQNLTANAKVNGLSSNEKKITDWMEEEVTRIQRLADDVTRTCNVTKEMHDKQVSLRSFFQVSFSYISNIRLMVKWFLI